MLLLLLLLLPCMTLLNIQVWGTYSFFLFFSSSLYVCPSSSLSLSLLPLTFVLRDSRATSCWRNLPYNWHKWVYQAYKSPYDIHNNTHTSLKKDNSWKKIEKVSSSHFTSLSILLIILLINHMSFAQISYYTPSFTQPPPSSCHHEDGGGYPFFWWR